MFLQQVRRNSSKNRRENGLYFASLIVAIIFSYILLSLGDQDVMLFLKSIESDAVHKLLRLLPMVYIVSLFFVFFMVYFSGKYQMQRRSHEFGIYQMLGMRQRTLFLLLTGETIWNSCVALLIGIPLSIMMTELISLLTVRLAGLGIIGHQFRISVTGLTGTILGFLAVQMAALLCLSILTGKKEPLELLREDKERIQRIKPARQSVLSLSCGVLLLLCAYGMGIFGLRSFSQGITLAIICTGIAGTFLLFRGLGSLIGRIIYKKGGNSTGLFVFTGRQLQENVFCQSKSLAISSLLIFLAMVCTAYGIGSAAGSDAGVKKTADFSLAGEASEIKKVMESKDIKTYVAAYYPMYVNHMNTLKSDESGLTMGKDPGSFSWDGLRNAADEVLDSKERERVLQWMSDDSYPYIISLSSYNALLKSTGSSGLYLDSGEVAVYCGYVTGIFREMQKMINNKPDIIINGTAYEIAGEVQSNNLVADRMISISIALIVPDDMYQKLAADQEPLCWNVTLEKTFIKEQGLMQALDHMGALLSDSGLEYESYLKGLGRNLFYIVGGSYLTLYMGILFLVISNTVLGIKFLLQQRDTRHRYKTVLMLGAGETELCRSARTQIRVYFRMVIGSAAISAVFGICSMFVSFLKLPEPAEFGKIAIVTMAAVIGFLIVEYAYILLIEHESDKEIRKMAAADTE